MGRRTGADKIDENELKELRERAKTWNMASNAIVRLLFNTADFDKNIKRAKGEIGNFEKGITSMASKIGPALSGFAAFAGISATIGDAVRTSMEFENRYLL